MVNHNYWTAAPFISHDGPDEEGFRAEVRVKKGYGLPISLTPSEKGKAYQATFDTGHARFKSHGWIPKEDPLYKIVEQAIEDKECLEFRIEGKRRKGVDRHISMEELLEGDTTTTLSNALVAIRKDDGEWQTSPTALTRFDEDPKSDNGNYSANDFTPEELGIGVTKTNNNITTTTLAPNDPGSEAVKVPMEILAFVNEYFEHRGVSDILNDQAKLAAVKTILTACNETQKQVTEVETPDLTHPSHARARQAIFLVLEHYIPLEGNMLTKNSEGKLDREALATWHREAVKKAAGMWRWSISEVDKLLN